MPTCPTLIALTEELWISASGIVASICYPSLIVGLF
jgi:hypothetical protein